MTYSIAILGASGYTGAELIRLIAGFERLDGGDQRLGRPSEAVVAPA